MISVRYFVVACSLFCAFPSASIEPLPDVRVKLVLSIQAEALSPSALRGYLSREFRKIPEVVLVSQDSLFTVNIRIFESHLVSGSLLGYVYTIVVAYHPKVVMDIPSWLSPLLEHFGVLVYYGSSLTDSNMSSVHSRLADIALEFDAHIEGFREIHYDSQR